MAGTIWDEEPNVYIGREPVWFSTQGLTLEQGRAVEHLATVPTLRGGPDGYLIYVEWITLADFNGDIHVTIADSSSGKEVAAHPAAYMHDAHVLVPSETQVIAVGPTPPYRIFETTVAIPAAGCYTVTTTSSGGNWNAIVAVGK